MKEKDILGVSRRTFLSHSARLLLALQASGLTACASNPQREAVPEGSPKDGGILPENTPEASPETGLNPDKPTSITYPRAIVDTSRKAEVKAKIQEEPFAAIFQKVKDLANRAPREPVKGKWDRGIHSDNARIAEANAFLAWLNDDEGAAKRSLAAMEKLETNWQEHGVWDINIRMPAPLMHYAAAWDLLRGTDYFPKPAQESLKQKLFTITDLFFKEYVVNDGTRGLVLTPAQNNHPIRTACAIGFVGIIFSDDPKAQPWLNWSLSELDYLWGANGQYVLADGGVTEGPHYYGFALAPTIPFFIAMENAIDPKRTFQRSCINRSELDPWKGHGCKEKEAFQFQNPLRTPYYQRTIEWSLAQRIYQGQRAPIADSNLTSINGPPILVAFGAPSYHYWDWASNPKNPYKISGGFDLAIYHLLYTPKPAKVEPPPWTNRFFPETGLAAFRSGWDNEAISLLLLAERGSSRKTLHDHVDSTSFVLTAYDEMMVIDTGYYKKSSLDNPITANPPSHSVILIDGKGAPDKGVLNRWGDADAYLENTLDGKALSWAEAKQTYQKTTITRGVAFVRQRYFVMADRLSTTHDKPREHRFRIHPYAGRDVPDSSVKFESYGAHVQRKKAGMHMHIRSTQGTVRQEEPPHKKHQVPHVHKVEGKVADHVVCDSVVSAVAPQFLTVFAPYKNNAPPSSLEGELKVTSVDCGEDAAGWLIQTTQGTDFAWLRGPNAKTTVKLTDGTAETDAAFALFSLDGKMALISRGKKLTWKGKAILEKDASSSVAKKET